VRAVQAVPVEGGPLLSKLPPCSCSSARFGEDHAPQMPVRRARSRAVLTVDDPPATNRARIAVRHPRHSHGLVLRKEVSSFVCPCQKYYRCRCRLISLEGDAEGTKINDDV
jgi:hypothetical protein